MTFQQIAPLLLLLLAGPSSVRTAGAPDEPPASSNAEARVTVFANEPFYRKRREPEEILIGVLRAAVVRQGPNTRSLPFFLVVGDNQFPVYSSGVDDAILRRFVDKRVRVTGKRIDQRAEGFATEIWIATIEPFGGNE